VSFIDRWRLSGNKVPRPRICSADAKDYHVHREARIQRSTLGVPDSFWFDLITPRTSTLKLFAPCRSVVSTGMPGLYARMHAALEDL